MRPGRTLLTGFEPFGHLEANTSQLIVEAIRSRKLPDVVTAVLPTSYRRAEKELGGLITSHSPDRLMMLGMDSGARHLKLEQVALNLDDSPAPDNDGETRVRRRIVDDGPVGYWASLDLEGLADMAERRRGEVEFSRDAGGYVCNHVFFVGAHIAATTEEGMTFGFVHLPPVEGPGEQLTVLVDIVAAWLV